MLCLDNGIMGACFQAPHAAPGQWQMETQSCVDSGTVRRLLQLKFWTTEGPYVIQASKLHGCKFPGSPCHTQTKTDGNTPCSLIKFIF